MHLKQRIGALLAAGLTALPLAVPARAAEFTDLPESHWAYEAMSRANALGIIQGTGGGAMNPSGGLSWGQFLAMAARTFAPGAYDDAMAEGEAWDQAGYTAAVEARLLRERDGLPVSPDSLGAPVTRQDAAVVLARALPDPDRHYGWGWEDPLDPTTLTDWGRMDELHQEAVAALAEQSILTGKADGSFGYADTLQRADGAALIVRVLDKVDASRSGEEKTVTIRVVDSTTGRTILPDQTMELTVNAALSVVAGGLDVGYYSYDYAGQSVDAVSSACDTYTLAFRPMSDSEIQEEQFWEQVEQGTATWEDYYLQDFWLTYQGENPRKLLLLFGDQNKRRFASREEAEAGMAVVTIPVWQLSGYMILIYVAGFMGLSQDVMEAASIDGATGWVKLKSIILPLMMSSITICLFLTLSRAFMVYDVNLSLTAGAPYGTTEMAAMHVYEKAFTSRQFGVGQAEALILFVIVAIISGIQVYLTKRQEVEA